jgi:hypothetical protein
MRESGLAGTYSAKLLICTELLRTYTKAVIGDKIIACLPIYGNLPIAFNIA